jgi:hypothetical protein
MNCPLEGTLGVYLSHIYLSFSCLPVRRVSTLYGYLVRRLPASGTVALAKEEGEQKKPVMN